jgi:hypothetical protein
MKIGAETKDAILFIGGCIGMAVSGLILPILGYDYQTELFLGWMGVATAGVVTGMNSRNGNGKREQEES